MTTFQTANLALAIYSTALAIVSSAFVIYSSALVVYFISGHLRRFPSIFAKRTNLPCNPNFAKKLSNLSYALAIFQIAFRWHSVSVRHMGS